MAQRMYPGDQGYGCFEGWMNRNYGRVFAPGDAEYEGAWARYDALLDESVREARVMIAQTRRENRTSGLWEVLKLGWKSVWHMGMYSDDPYLARIAMVHTAQEQIGVQRQIASSQRLEDQAREEQRMRFLAREMAREMVAEVRRHDSPS